MSTTAQQLRDRLTVLEQTAPRLPVSILAVILLLGSTMVPGGFAWVMFAMGVVSVVVAQAPTVQQLVLRCRLQAVDRSGFTDMPLLLPLSLVTAIWMVGAVAAMLLGR